MIRVSTPVSRARRNARAGSRPRRSFESSPCPSAVMPPPIRSAETWARPAAPASIWATVSGARSNPSCDTNRSARTMRSGSSSKLVGPTVRIVRRARSSWPPNGSTMGPPSSGSAMALIVKSRRAMSSSSPMSASLTIAKSRWPGPVDRSARGGVSSMPAGASARIARSLGKRRTPTSCPCTSMSSTRPWGSSSALSPAWSTPGTRKSSSAWGSPSSSSRTAPPTT